MARNSGPAAVRGRASVGAERWERRAEVSGSDVETVVIGAGVVGLAVARALARRGGAPLVLERNDRIGAEISSRSSEVIHAGIYYPPGSLKARLCVEGRRMLYRFAAQNGVAVRRCGKLLVATSATEQAALAALLATGRANGVDDLVPLDGAAARRLEPALACVAAVLSPSTGVVDSHGLMQALEGHLTARGGAVVLAHAAESLEALPGGGFRLATRAAASGEMASLTARRVVLAAGLGGSALADSLFPDHGVPANGGPAKGVPAKGEPAAPRYRPPRTYPAKGHYFSLAGASPFRHLVYPMPQGAWLGVHLTLDIGGRAKFGPDLEWTERIDYACDDPGGAREARFAAEIRRYWPALPDGALAPAYSGIRPKIYRSGEPAPDFAIHGPRQHGLAGLVALYGIESPGLTASLAIGDHVADLLDEAEA